MPSYGECLGIREVAAFQRAANGAIYFTFFDDFALIMLLFTACQRDLNFNKSPLSIQFYGDNCQVSPAQLSLQPIKLFLAQQQLSWPFGSKQRAWLPFGRFIRRNMGLHQPGSAIFQRHIAALKVDVTQFDGLDFTAQKFNTGFERFRNSVVEESLFIEGELWHRCMSIEYFARVVTEAHLQYTTKYEGYGTKRYQRSDSGAAKTGHLVG